jgi:hypothetical protein
MGHRGGRRGPVAGSPGDGPVRHRRSGGRRRPRRVWAQQFNIIMTFKPQSREKNSQSLTMARSRELAAEIAQSILTSCRILPQSLTNCYVCEGVKPVTFLRGHAKSGKLSVLIAIRRSIGESPCWLTMSQSQRSVAPWK